MARGWYETYDRISSSALCWNIPTRTARMYVCMLIYAHICTFVLCGLCHLNIFSFSFGIWYTTQSPVVRIVKCSNIEKKTTVNRDFTITDETRSITRMRAVQCNTVLWKNWGVKTGLGCILARIGSCLTASHALPCDIDSQCRCPQLTFSGSGGLRGWNKGIGHAGVSTRIPGYKRKTVVRIPWRIGRLPVYRRRED